LSPFTVVPTSLPPTTDGKTQKHHRPQQPAGTDAREELQQKVGTPLTYVPHNAVTCVRCNEIQKKLKKNTKINQNIE